MIYTSYFAKLRALPSSVVPIAICAKVPDWFPGFQYRMLAPKYGFFMRWEENHDDNYYTCCFQEQVLDKLDARVVVDDLAALSGGKDICLVCWEKPQDFCHRHLVAAWLRDNGFACKEYGEALE